MEGGTEESAGMGHHFQEHTQHLDAAGAAFLRTWVHLLAMEERDLGHKRAELWQLPGACLPHQRT